MVQWCYQHYRLSSWLRVSDLADVDGTNGFVINGIAVSDRIGTVSNIGDINNDGIDDVIIGARLADPDGLTAAGQVYVLFGRSDIGITGPFEPSSLDGNNSFFINGANLGDRIGVFVNGAGDMNGDGVFRSDYRCRWRRSEWKRFRCKLCDLRRRQHRR